MDDHIVVSDTAQLREKTAEAAQLLGSFKESLEAEKGRYQRLYAILEQTEQALVTEERQLLVTLEQYAKEQKKSEAAQHAHGYVKQRLARCNKNQRQIDKCRLEYEAMTRELGLDIQESGQLADQGKLLAEKLGRILTLMENSK